MNQGNKSLRKRKIELETLAEIQRCYAQIVGGSGYGTIKIRIRLAGQQNESHFVAVETERKTR